MRSANILTGIAVLLWLSLIVAGHDLVRGVVNQRVLGYPGMGQIDFLIVWPTIVVLILILCAWAVNGLRRWYVFLAAISGAALLALLPYLFVYGGGV